ncbi:MAG: glycosyltransferase family 4 protein [Burkholderiales bacterium]|nr:glycosyltransferase family 4 protein [Burkholderiales bacterium]
MRVLFIHQNIPGQFRHLIAALCADPANEVWAIAGEGAARRAGALHPRLRVMPYRVPVPAPEQRTAHPWLMSLDSQLRRGQAVAEVLSRMKTSGVSPDVIVAHPSWGEALFVKDVLPATPLLAYFEFFYSAAGADVGFDPEFPGRPEDGPRLRMRNLVHLSALSACDAGFTPTRWQHARLPPEYQERVSIIHEGIDTDAVRPAPEGRFEWQGRLFRAGEPIVTYVARNLEPYRGFHVFMRSLPALLARHPTLQVLIVGGEQVSYGTPAGHPAGWKSQLVDELAGKGTPIDAERVHFLGKLGHADYVRVLQVSAAHVYLTYPFVLSWSMLEAMAAGCLVIGSDTAPVTEVLADGVNGRLVDFFDREELVSVILDVLGDPGRHRRLREAARATAIERFDLQRLCLPAGLALIRSMQVGRDAQGSGDSREVRP